MAETTNKVNPEATEGQTPGTEKPEKEKGRVDFVITDAQCRDTEGNIVTAVNSEGLLIAVPKPLKDAEGKVVYAGFNCRKHNPLKKGDFADIASFMLHRAFVLKVRAAILVKSSEQLETKAAHIAKFGDEETRKKVQRVARMKEQLLTLEKQLEDDGVDISDI